MIKKGIKNFLYKKGIYYPLKYSRLFHLYELLFKPQTIKQHRQEISLYRSFLPPCKLIFDIGANDGHKTAAFITMSETVVCCEPDKENFRLLTVRFRNKKTRIIIENKALSDKEGEAELLIHHPGSAFNTLSNKWQLLLEKDGEERWNEQIRFTGTTTIQTTTLDKLIEKYGRPDYIKIDVEGFEEHVLKGLSQPVAYLSFETLLPDYKNELLNCLDKIHSLDSSASFNIALHEKLVLPGWINREVLDDWLNANNNGPGFEVIVKMKT